MYEIEGSRRKLTPEETGVIRNKVVASIDTYNSDPTRADEISDWAVGEYTSHIFEGTPDDLITSFALRSLMILKYGMLSEIDLDETKQIVQGEKGYSLTARILSETEIDKRMRELVAGEVTTVDPQNPY